MELVRVTCKCGHRGKSKQPEFYRCTACDQEARVAVLKEGVKVLLEQIRVKLLEAAMREELAVAFRRKHNTTRSV